MTRAPSNLLAVRSLLLAHLDGLAPGAVGIVGDPAHRGGYHCGDDRVVSSDYSVVESPRDRAGLSDLACGLDVGNFRVTTARGTFDLPHYSRWLVAQCAANTSDTRDIREVIYSPDGRIVKRWDRLGKRSTGDDSHLYHTHQSYFRDAIKAGRDQTPAVRRYLTTIGLLEDDMSLTPEEHQWLADVRYATTRLDGRNPLGQVYTRLADGTDATDPDYRSSFLPLKALGERLTNIEMHMAKLVGRDFTDEASIVTGVLAGLTPDLFAEAIKRAGLTPEALAALIPEEMADDVVNAMAARLAGQ